MPNQVQADLSAAQALRIGPLHIERRRADTAMAALLEAISKRRRLNIAFANTNLLYHALRDDAYAREMERFLLLNDGIGIEMLARLLCRRGFAENLNGTDFAPRLLDAAPKGTKLYLVGAAPAIVAEAAREIARRSPQIDIVGFRDGYSCSGGHQFEVNQDITRSGAEIVLVAMGNPLQEQWIARCPHEAEGPVFIGVGALFDFLAGVAPRAPALMRRLRLEWLFRMLNEPERLWRRYTIEAAYVAFHSARWALTRNMRSIER